MSNDEFWNWFNNIRTTPVSFSNLDIGMVSFLFKCNSKYEFHTTLRVLAPERFNFAQSPHLVTKTFISLAYFKPFKLQLILFEGQVGAIRSDLLKDTASVISC